MDNNIEKLKLRDIQIARFNNDFFRKYESSFNSIGKTFKREKADYVIALSRKAPRLIELFRFIDIYLGNTIIMSEKAIDFVPPKVFNGKKIIIFDDIIISGTTIKNLVLELSNKYNIKIKVICLAIDKDTIAFEKDINNNYFITLNNGDKVFLEYKVALSKDERFIFCNEIVRSFIFLNKSYDIDYPIFYASINSHVMFSLLTQSSPDTAYNLTTVYQYNNDYRRYTFFPTQEANINSLYNNIFQNFHFLPKIGKVRVFYDEKSNETTLVPMITFGMDTKSFKEDRIFSDRFSYYNDLINRVKEFINQGKTNETIYRFIWYIVNYLYGLSFILRNLTGKHNYKYMAPSEILSHSDIQYIFGPSVTKILIDFLDSSYSKTIQDLNEICSGQNTQNNLLSESCKNRYLENTNDSPFDKVRKQLYEEIKPFLKNNINSYNSFTSQIASIFEGLYYSKEISSQETVKKSGIKGEEHKRLGIGFNYDQIKEILDKEGIIAKKTNNVDLIISLSFDFLVDAGIQIPIFYYERDDGFFERVYRYGEDALSAKKYGYLIASIVEKLFNYIDNLHGRKALPRIAFEKNGIILHEEMIRTGVVDILKGFLNPDDRNIIVSPSYCRHGKVLHIRDEAYEQSNSSPFFFTEWCAKEKIINYIKNGVSYSNKFFERLKFSNGDLPKLISDDKIAIFQSIVLLLYYVNCIIDKSKRSNFLIALTACGAHESYVWALREELQLFFKSSDYSFSLPLSRTIQYLKNEEFRTQKTLEETLNLLSKKSYSVAHAIRHKKKLWDRFNKIIYSIEEYFNKCSSELKLLYNLNLKTYIDIIKLEHNKPVDDFLKIFIEEILVLGELCIHISTILKNLIDLSIKMYKLRITKEGDVHRTDLRVINDKLKSLNRSINAWNEYFEKPLSPQFSEVFNDNLPNINKDSSLNNFQYSVNECNRLIEKLISEIGKNYAKLENIYNKNCPLSVWKGKMKYFFAKGKDLEYIGIKKSIDAANKSVPEDSEIHPKVGAVIINDDRILCEAFRGEIVPGDHAEYTALIKKCENFDLKSATLITTLEPCTTSVKSS